MIRSSGISKKLTWPAIALTVIGGALTVVGLLTHDSTVTTTGLSLIGGAGLIQVPVAYAAPPTGLTHDVPSDDLLPPDPTGLATGGTITKPGV